jgi:hypothetical protein
MHVRGIMDWLSGSQKWTPLANLLHHVVGQVYLDKYLSTLRGTIQAVATTSFHDDVLVSLMYGFWGRDERDGKDESSPFLSDDFRLPTPPVDSSLFSSFYDFHCQAYAGSEFPNLEGRLTISPLLVAFMALGPATGSALIRRTICVLRPSYFRVKSKPVLNSTAMAMYRKNKKLGSEGVCTTIRVFMPL